MEDQMRAVSEAFNDEMRQSREFALALGRATAFSASQAAEGISRLVEAGKRAEEALNQAVQKVQEVSMPEIIIRNPKDGREYGIQSADFKRGKHYMNAKTGEYQTFEEAGFTIVSLGDGQPYDGPLNDPPAPRAQGEHAP